MLTKGEAIVDILIAVMAVVCILFGFGGDNPAHTLALIWGGMCLGYLVTVYMNGEEDDQI